MHSQLAGGEVELPPTAASAWREREGKSQAAQQENTEQGTGYGNVIPRGCDVKSARRKAQLGTAAALEKQVYKAARCVSYARLGLDDRKGVAPRRPVSISELHGGRMAPRNPLNRCGSWAARTVQGVRARHCAMAESWSAA